MASDISVIIPVYNRPQELKELLDSLVCQSDKYFEVIVVDDGSTEKSDTVVQQYKDKLSARYFYKDNSGPGPSRNYGCTQSKADFFIFFDSGCIIPENYFKSLRKIIGQVEAFGGPDKAHRSFSAVQKAISYSMTSVFTTGGGIRGGDKSVGKFHLRSFNMGFSREVYEKTGGFSNLRFGEDIDLSIRIFKNGFKTRLIPECFVYHKKRTDFGKFFRQVFNSGIARINLYKRHPASLKLLLFFPSAFVLYQVLSIPHAVYHREFRVLWPTIIYLSAILVHASIVNRNVWLGMLSTWASLVQLSGYGLGFIKGFIRRILLRQPEFHAFNKTFYD